jgi:hypothetical protein
MNCEIRTAAALVLTTRTDDDPAALGAVYVSTWPFMTVAKADQNAAWNASKGRKSEVITTCHDHGQPIVRAVNLGGRWDGQCVGCVEAADRVAARRRRHGRRYVWS